MRSTTGFKVWLLETWAAIGAKLAGRQPVRPGYVRTFVYGSLKPGFYNFNRSYYPKDAFESVKFGDAAIQITEDVVRGMTLVALGGYPGAIATTTNKWITGVVMDVPDELAAEIAFMETGAGYSAQHVKTDKGYDVLVWQYENQWGRKLNHVGSTWTLDHQNGRMKSPQQA
jgi:gamma-glutamylcyclotransferase (GGCT)/AIG2-like uncharacterized protein YtfP